MTKLKMPKAVHVRRKSARISKDICVEGKPTTQRFRLDAAHEQEINPPQLLVNKMSMGPPHVVLIFSVHNFGV